MNSSEPSASQRWRFDLAYDGHAFAGFAQQARGETVAGLLRATLTTTLGLDHEPTIVGAGRTDRGVHAFGQVIHVDLPVERTDRVDPEKLCRSLNAQLRGRVQVLALRAVDATFHARFSATWREYRYLVLESNAPGLSFTNAWAWSVRGPLDLAAMNEAATDAIGAHDFRAFCRRPSSSHADQALTRRVLAASWERRRDDWSLSATSPEALRLTIRAQSFCHTMVRALTSTMVAIGRAKLPVSTVRERLESADRSHLPPPAPPGGLALIAVGYEESPRDSSGLDR